MNKHNNSWIAALFCCIWVFNTAAAQETAFPKGFYFRLGVAYSPVLNAPGISALADPLVALPRHNVSIPFEFQWQMKSRFGLVFQYRPVNIDANIRSAVGHEVARQFPNDFAAVYLPGVYEGLNNGDDASQAFITLSYALEAGKWAIQPRLMLGGTTYYPLTAEITLKRRDSNQLNVLTLEPILADPDTGASTIITFGLGALAQRHLWRRWSVFYIAEWTACKPDLSYTYALENQIDNSTNTQILSSNQVVQMLHLGGGLTFRISRK